MTEIRYSIKDLENFTQIKAHTIRIWESRYGLLTPSRTDTNIRYYGEEDLKKILNINLLYTSGLKISKIAALTESEIISNSKALILEEDTDKQSEIDMLTVMILAFDGDAIKYYLDERLEKEELEDLYTTVVIPLLEKIGQLWQVNSIDIIHEHYFSNIFREFIINKTEGLKSPSRFEKTSILFLHDEEEHEFAILLYNYILKKHGYNCHNFGQNVPIKEIDTAYSQLMPDIVVTTFTALLSEKDFRVIEKELLKFIKNSEVIISGSQLDAFEFSFSKKLKHIRSIQELKLHLS
ncbi:MAG: MerR family transcriptional regulator [Crocinitomicaceae bacterium]|nr:MerR family transcriptional regulator [Crocinitomicaceae bacterium]